MRYRCVELVQQLVDGLHPTRIGSRCHPLHGRTSANHVDGGRRFGDDRGKGALGRFGRGADHGSCNHEGNGRGDIGWGRHVAAILRTKPRQGNLLAPLVSSSDSESRLEDRDRAHSVPDLPGRFGARDRL